MLRIVREDLFHERCAKHRDNVILNVTGDWFLQPYTQPQTPSFKTSLACSTLCAATTSTASSPPTSPRAGSRSSIRRCAQPHQGLVHDLQ
jgi:hypothetical protein